MITLQVIGFSIICGLINIRNVNACCCTYWIPYRPFVSDICIGGCAFDCNFFGCNCGTWDGLCVHYKDPVPNENTRCKDPYFKAFKSSEYCSARFMHLPMLDNDSDGAIGRREITEYLVKRNATENTYESNKMLMAFREKFNDIDENKDGYIQTTELDNVNRYT